MHVFVDFDLVDADQDTIAHIGRGDATLALESLYRRRHDDGAVLEVPLWDPDATEDCGTLTVKMDVYRRA